MVFKFFMVHCVEAQSSNAINKLKIVEIKPST